MAFRSYTDQVLLEGRQSLHHYEAAEDVKQGQLVKYDSDSGGRTVEPSDTDGEGGLAGFALYDAAAGEEVAVAQSGAIVRATSGTGAVSAGDSVVSHGGTGEEGEVAAGATTGDVVIGHAIEDDGGDGGDVVVRVDYGGELN